MARTLKTATILKRAKALIENPRNWTQHTYGRKDSRVPNGTGFRCCALGAVRLAVSGTTPLEGYDGIEAADLLHACARELFEGLEVHEVNDGRTGHSRKKAHADVLKAFDCAISKANGK